MKIVKWVVLGLVLLVVIGVGVGFFYLNTIVRSTVENQSQKQLNVPVSLASANVGVFSGKLGLENYNIGSPKGFASPQMFSVGDLKVAVNYRQLTDDPIRIQSIDIEQPKLVLEQSGGKFNIQALMEQLAPTAPADQPAESKPVRLIIDHLRINGATVALRPGDLSQIPMLGSLDLKKLDIKEEYKLTIAPIDISNIGTAEGNQNGAAIKDVVMQVVSAISAKAAQSDELPQPVRMLLSGNLDAMGDMLKDQVQQQIGKVADDLTKKLPGDAGKALDQTLKDVGGGKDPGKAIEEGLGGLFDKKKEKNEPKSAPPQPAKSPTH